MSVIQRNITESWAAGEILCITEDIRLGWPSGFLCLTTFDDTPLCIAIDAMRDMYTGSQAI